MTNSSGFRFAPLAGDSDTDAGESPFFFFDALAPGDRAGAGAGAGAMSRLGIFGAGGGALALAVGDRNDRGDAFGDFLGDFAPAPGDRGDLVAVAVDGAGAGAAPRPPVESPPLADRRRFGGLSGSAASSNALRHRFNDPPTLMITSIALLAS